MGFVVALVSALVGSAIAGGYMVIAIIDLGPQPRPARQDFLNPHNLRMLETCAIFFAVTICVGNFIYRLVGAADRGVKVERQIEMYGLLTALVAGVLVIVC